MKRLYAICLLFLSCTAFADVGWECGAKEAQAFYGSDRFYVYINGKEVKVATLDPQQYWRYKLVAADTTGDFRAVRQFDVAEPKLGGELFFTVNEAAFHFFATYVDVTSESVSTLSASCKRL